MLAVKFHDEIVISEDKLGALLMLAGVPASVRPHHELVAAQAAVADAPKRRGRKPKADAAPTTPAVPGKKRGRKSNAEKAAMAAAAATDAAPAVAEAATEAAQAEESATAEAAPVDPPKDQADPVAPPAEAAPAASKPAKKSGGKKNGSEAKAEPAAEPADPGELLPRFSALIDKDFAGAKAVLEGFGVSKFSEIPPANYPSLSEKLTELGV